MGQFQTGKSGTLVLSATELSFAEWRVPYKKIKSALLHKQYVFLWPRYTLLLTDGTHNFLFQIPRREAEISLPFAVETETSGRYIRLLGWFWITTLVLGGFIALANHFSRG